MSAKPSGFLGTFRDDVTARAVYSEAAGIGRKIPRAVAVPTNAEDVVKLVDWARNSRIPLTPRGSGSSMAGGAIGDGVIVDLSEMRSLDDIDVESRSVKVGPGVTCAALNAAARNHGLRFPVDPSSSAFCTIGGMVSTNASGARTLRYGSTRAWVKSLDCVFADASRATLTRNRPAPSSLEPVAQFMEHAYPEIMNAREAIVAAHSGLRKDSSGYGLRAFIETGDLVDLIVGSEGTLAIVVGAELSLGQLPVSTSGVLAAFTSLEQAVEGASRAREAGAAACELLDRTFLDVARGSAALALGSVPEGTEAVLIAEAEADSDSEASSLAEEIARGFRDAGSASVSVALTIAAQTEIWELRHAASPILSTLDPSLASMQFIEDGAVPPDRLADYVRGVRKALDSRGIRGVIFGHAGDAHVHVNPLIDMSEPGWRENMVGLLDDVVTLTSRLEGTLSGEHGDGSLRAPFLPWVWPPKLVEIFQMIKSRFDPEGILNPGVKIPLARQKAIEDVKYDPNLEPLPAAARQALDEVAAKRAYATNRLSLIDGHA